jgi:hypothetical protein
MKTYTLNEYMNHDVHRHKGVQGPRLRALCADGFSISVQASKFHYCTPRVNGPIEEYTAFELGFPSEAEGVLLEYAEDKSSPTDTVYGRVPRDVVEALLEEHGGIVGVALS